MMQTCSMIKLQVSLLLRFFTISTRPFNSLGGNVQNVFMSFSRRIVWNKQVIFVKLWPTLEFKFDQELRFR